MSDITVQNVADYLRLDSAEDAFLTDILDAAKSYVLTYTGQTAEYLDDYPDVSVAVLALSQDMYDHRTMYADKGSINRVVESILGRYRANFLPSCEEVG